MAKILDCKGIAENYREKIRSEIKELGYLPKLATILATEDPGSKAYASLIRRDCDKLGVYTEDYHVFNRSELKSAVDYCNDDKETSGIFIFYPVGYPGLDDQVIMNLVHPRKDIEGIHAENLGHLVQYRRFLDNEEKYRCIVPCTPKAVVKTLQNYPDIEIEGKYVTIINNSIPVGKALGMMLENLEATVINCHVKTDYKDLKQCIKMADILITAVPGENFVVDSGLVKDGAVVVDIAFQGNIDYDSLEKKTSYITHPKNGIGIMTRTMLFQNLSYAAKYKGIYY